MRHQHRNEVSQYEWAFDMGVELYSDYGNEEFNMILQELVEKKTLSWLDENYCNYPVITDLLH